MDLSEEGQSTIEATPQSNQFNLSLSSCAPYLPLIFSLSLRNKMQIHWQKIFVMKYNVTVISIK